VKVWKDILREGEFAITPGLGKRMPFSVVADGKSSLSERRISISELEKSFDDKAFEHVGIALAASDGSHRTADDVLNNHGFTQKLRRKVKDGVTYLQAGLGFTEPDAKGKVQRGTIPNVSSGIYFNHTRKADGKTFPVALNHVLLCKNPWIDKLEPFKAILASEGNPNPDIESYQFADSEESNTVEVIWDDKDGANWIRTKLQEAISPSDPPVEDGRPYTPKATYYVEDISPARNIALVQEYFRGVSTKFLIPFTRTEDAVEPAPNIRWTEVREAMIAASDPNDEDLFALAAKREEFSKVSSSKIKSKLELALTDMLGENSKQYRIDEISLDNRCLITDKTKEVTFAASFSIATDKSKVFLSASSEWEKMTSPKENVKEKTLVSKVVTTKTIGLSDDMIARVKAAREERKKLMSYR
jgi:hypothetical protein